MDNMNNKPKGLNSRTVHSQNLENYFSHLPSPRPILAISQPFLAVFPLPSTSPCQPLCSPAEGFNGLTVRLLFDTQRTAQKCIRAMIQNKAADTLIRDLQVSD